jgi:hypothetical protein
MLMSALPRSATGPWPRRERSRESENGLVSPLSTSDRPPKPRAATPDVEAGFP